jgi:hypothetical protein
MSQLSQALASRHSAIAWRRYGVKLLECKSKPHVIY